MSEERIYKEESYKGYSIKIMYDDCPECPTEFYDMCGAFLWEYSDTHRLSNHCHWEQVFGKNGSSDHTLNEALTQIIEDHINIKKLHKYIKADKKINFYYDRSRKLWVFEEWDEYHKAYCEVFTCDSGKWKAGDYLWEMLDGRDKDELIDILNKCADNIVIYEWSSTGYSQGEYVEGVAFITKEMADKLWLRNKDNWKQVAMKAMEAGAKEIGAWMWGDVYGYVIEDENGDHVESCYGYYGDETIDEYIIPEAKNIIDAHITRLEKEHEERLEIVKANIDKLKGKIFIGYPECYQVTNDIFGQTVVQKADGSHGHIEHFYDDVNLKDIPDDVLKNMEKAIA